MSPEYSVPNTEEPNNLLAHIFPKCASRRLSFQTVRKDALPDVLCRYFQVGTAELTSAHIADSVLVLVVNQKVYIYDYEANSWNTSLGICVLYFFLFCLQSANIQEQVY